MTLLAKRWLTTICVTHYCMIVVYACVCVYVCMYMCVQTSLASKILINELQYVLNAFSIEIACFCAIHCPL